MWDQKRSASEAFVDLVAASAAGEQGEEPRCPPVAAARKQAAGQGWTPVGSLRPDPCRLSRRQRFPNGRTQPTRPANSQPPNWASCSKSWRDNLFDILVYENIWKYCNTLVATEAKKQFLWEQAWNGYAHQQEKTQIQDYLTFSRIRSNNIFSVKNTTAYREKGAYNVKFINRDMQLWDSRPLREK